MGKIVSMEPGIHLIKKFLPGYCIACRKKLETENGGPQICSDCLPTPGQVLVVCCNSAHDPERRVWRVNYSVKEEVHSKIDKIYPARLEVVEHNRAFIVFTSHCKECDPEQKETVVILDRAVDFKT